RICKKDRGLGVILVMNRAAMGLGLLARSGCAYARACGSAVGFLFVSFRGLRNPTKPKTASRRPRCGVLVRDWRTSLVDNVDEGGPVRRKENSHWQMAF